MTKPTCLVIGILALITFEGSKSARCQECKRGKYDALTDDFSIRASSDQGAVGDVVAVDVSLSIEKYHDRPYGFSVVGCYDSAVADLVETPSYSELFGQVAVLYDFFALGVPPGPQKPDHGRGFLLFGNFRADNVENLILAGELPIMTLYFRLKGTPGGSFTVDFCDGQFRNTVASCVDNTLLYASDPETKNPLDARSNRHVGGKIRILPGPPTRTELPSIPPDAKVYDQSPSAEETAARFEVVGSVATPGSTEVPVRVFIASAYEFSGFSISMKFPKEFLAIARVEEHVRPGAVRFDNDQGIFGLVLAQGNRRTGAEGERVHAATLYFDVKEAAREVSSIPVTLEQTAFHMNWVRVRSRNGEVSGRLPIATDVSPILLLSSAIQVRGEVLTVLGDANRDTRLDIADPLALLSYLFLAGRAPDCPEAADYNRDGRLDIADPIAMLSALFFGSPPAEGQFEAEVSCR